MNDWLIVWLKKMNEWTGQQVNGWMKEWTNDQKKDRYTNERKYSFMNDWDNLTGSNTEISLHLHWQHFSRSFCRYWLSLSSFQRHAPQPKQRTQTLLVCLIRHLTRYVDIRRLARHLSINKLTNNNKISEKCTNKKAGIIQIWYSARPFSLNKQTARQTDNKQMNIKPTSKQFWQTNK